MAYLQSRYQKLFQGAALAGDLLWLNAAFFLAVGLRFDEMRLQETAFYDYYVQLFVFFNLLWLVLSLVRRNYHLAITLVPRRSAGKTLNIISLHLFILLLLLVSLKRDEYSRLFLVYFYLSATVLLLLWRFAFVYFLRYWQQRGNGRLRLFILGDLIRYKQLQELSEQRPEFGLEAMAHQAQLEPETLKKRLHTEAIDEVLCTWEPHWPEAQQAFQLCQQAGVRFKFLPAWQLTHPQQWSVSFYGHIPVLSLQREPLELWHNRLLKRGLDIIIALLALTIITPLLFPIIALGILGSGKGGLIFKQQRTGYRNSDFTLYKFRSMRPNPLAHRQQAHINDRRVTPFGKWLRRLHLDELPQFWNVLKGNMSVVGPRPHMLEHTHTYQKMIDRYLVRHLVKPGITGLAQVRGLSGVHTPEQMEQRVQADVYYIENWSLLLDISILIQTLGVVIRGSQGEGTHF